MKAFLTLVSALPRVLFCFGAAAREIRVAIDGVASSSGTLMVGLYDSEEYFRIAIANAGKPESLNDPARLVGIATRAIAGTQSVVFSDLKPGTYGVVVFHDENDNGTFDENAWGMPTEDYAFSDNAARFLAPPSFKDAAVILDGRNRAITITLKYPRGRGEKPGY